MVSKKKPILTDNEIFSNLKGNRKVKRVEGGVPFAKNLGLFDVSIKGRGPREDDIFARFPFLRQNVPRGLTFLKPEGKGPVICRKGLQKFFDVKNEYLDLLDGKYDKNSGKINRTEETLYRVIFDEVQEALKKGEKVVVYKTEKANGENAQVSYNIENDAWIIASKNVSIMVRNMEDVKEYATYESDRYSFATLIAEAWFKLLRERVPNVGELKKDLAGKTIIGEYCGNQKYQHLVYYNEITILFFALVEYQSQRTCLPIKVAQDFLKKHNLPTVRVNPRKECHNIRDLVDTLTELSKEVSESTIEEDQEGSVLYFEVQSENRTEILSLCKLKTLEYRLYRKLREKLKVMIAKGYSVSRQMGSYTREVEELCEKYKPPKPMEDYYETARLALEFVSENSGIVRRLGISGRFLDFLNVIRACQKEGRKPEGKDFEKIIQAQDEVSEESEGDEPDEDEEDDETEEKGKGKGKAKKDVKKEKKNIEEKKVEEREEPTEKETKKTRKGRKSEEEEDVEENKIGEEMKQSTITEADLPKRIVIITPPLYFDWDMRRKIQERVGAKCLETDWKESTPIEGKRSVALLNRFPAVTKKKELEYNTVFLVAGFEQDSQKSTLKKLESIAQDKDRFQFSGFELMAIQSKDKEKSIELLWANAQKFGESIHQLLPNNYHILHLSKPDKILEEIDLALEKLKNFQAALEIPIVSPTPELTKADSKPKTKKSGNYTNQILVFIPIGIPGMGKTTFLNLLKKLLEEKGCEITIISSDKLRKQHMDEIMRKEPNVTEERAFERSAKPAKQQFFKDVEKAIEKTATMDKNSHIIFLDKNHPPNIIQETIEFFDKPKYKTKFRIRTVILKPQCGENFRTKANIYPFSLNFLLICMKRAMSRPDHETLMGDELKVAKVLISFFNLYKNYKAREADFKILGANFLMELPFTKEDPEVEKQIPLSLVISLQNVLQGLRGFEPDEDKVLLFLQEFGNLKVELKNPDPEVLYQASIENLNKCFNLFELKDKDNER